MTLFATADLSDAHSDQVQIAAPIFRQYGGQAQFHGAIATIKIFEDNVLVRQLLESEGNGRVLVVDGGGSLRCALVGDMLAQLAIDNGWTGLVVYGCIRDTAVIADMSIGIRALNTHPRKSVKRGEGVIDIPIHFAGISFYPGHYLYADADGILVASSPLI